MRSQRGLSQALLTECAELPFGRCLCGRAASTRQVVFRSRLDHHHEVTYEGIPEHGHYCVPILSGERVLGVLNLYVREGHERSRREEEFLMSVANTLAGIIERKQAEEALEHSATHDALTGLATRALLGDRLEQALAQARRYGHQVGLMFLDLDKFKEVNDSLGHETGDRLLVAVAAGLSSCVRACDTVARMGGDEFTIVLTRIAQPEETEIVARRVQKLFSQPFDAGRHHVSVGVSIGVAVFPRDGEDAKALLRRADGEMYQVKRAAQRSSIG